MIQAFLPVLVLVLSLAAALPAADTIFLNGKIATVDAQFRMVEAVAVRDGKILAAGTNTEIRKLRSPKTAEVDLQGKTVLPGLIDTHLHLRNDPYRLDLEKVRSLAELLKLVEGRARQAAAGAWIRGADWSEDNFTEKRRPTRQDLDRVAPEHPVYLIRAGGHSGVANSAALRLAGITRATKDPDGGIIERDDQGEPTGILRELAQGMVLRLAPPLGEDDRKKGYLESLRALPPLGITSIIEAGLAPGEVRLMQDLYERYGAELPRTVMQIRIPTSGTPQEIAARLRAIPFRTGFGNDRLKIGALKVGIDGGYTGAAAYTLAAYPGRPGYYGTLLVTEDRLAAIVREGAALGWQMGFHAIGDAAIQMCVDVYARVLQERPWPDHRLYLNHFTVMPPAATLDKMVRHGILVAQQPVFTYTLAGRYSENLQGMQLERNNPLRTLLDRKIHMALGNDNLPTGPMLCLYAAVTRKGMDGRVYGPEEKLTLQEAIRGFTRDAAYLSFDENVKGSLEPGKLADMVVLGEDIFTVPAERIKDLPIEKTIVGGRVVYAAGR